MGSTTTALPNQHASYHCTLHYRATCEPIIIGARPARRCTPPSARPGPSAASTPAAPIIAAARKSAGRLRHCARRYATLLQRCDRGVVSLHHIAGTENPADVLTKFVDRVKYKQSIEFLTNSKNEVPLSEA